MGAYTENELIEIGGKLWEGGPHRRIYFDLENFVGGIRVEQYNTGNISGFWFDGERLSNSQGKRVLALLDDAKIYYDCVKRAFTYTSTLGDTVPGDSGETYKDRIFATIKSRVTGLRRGGKS